MDYLLTLKAPRERGTLAIPSERWVQLALVRLVAPDCLPPAVLLLWALHASHAATCLAGSPAWAPK